MVVTLTGGVQAALDALDAAARDYVPGRDPASVIELPKLALADAVLAAIAEARAKLPARARPIAAGAALPDPTGTYSGRWDGRR